MIIAPPEPRASAPPVDAREEQPGLAPAPEPTAAARRMHRAFLALNRWLSVPLLRAGLGPWVGTPIGGYLLLLRVRGRRSGRIREIPLSYDVVEGAPWVLAGFGPATQWYRNLLADPDVEVVLPGRTLRCVAEDVRDPGTRARILPVLVRAIGLPAYLGGGDPYRDPDERVVERYGWVPLIRLRPSGGPIAATADDPGGTAWVWRQALVTVALLWTARRAIGLVRALLRR